MDKKAVIIDHTRERGQILAALTPVTKKLLRLQVTLDLEALPLGAKADLLYDLRTARLELNAIFAPTLEVLSELARTVEDHFVSTLEAGESSGVQGMRSRVQVTQSPIPVVKDWDKFYGHIKKTGQFELLNRAVNRTAVNERWDNKQQVPGVGTFVAKKVSCTKLNGKGK